MMPAARQVSPAVGSQKDIIYQALTFEYQSTSQLQQTTKLSVKRLSTLISMMIHDGTIQTLSRGSGMYRKMPLEVSSEALEPAGSEMSEGAAINSNEGSQS
jgi:hypothetical protein